MIWRGHGMPCPYETLSEQTIDEVMEKLKYKFILQSILPLLLACVYPVASSAQDWFRTGTGLGVEKARVAVPDFAPRTTSSQPVSRIFTEVLRGDLENSGILDMVSPSFFPEQTASIPAELKAASWNAPALVTEWGYGPSSPHAASEPPALHAAAYRP